MKSNNPFKKFPFLAVLISVGLLYLPLEKVCAEEPDCPGGGFEAVSNSVCHKKNIDRDCPISDVEDSCSFSGVFCVKQGPLQFDPNSSAPIKENPILTLYNPFVSHGLFGMVSPLLSSHLLRNRLGRSSTFFEIDFSRVKKISPVLSNSSFLC
jgi:hypothetical protein